jgi:integrase
MLPSLLGCGLRRSELIGLKLSHFQKRDDHWAIIDLYGKAPPEKIPANQLT